MADRVIDSSPRSSWERSTYARVHVGLGVSALHQWWVRHGVLRPDEGHERPGDGDPLRAAAPRDVAVLDARQTAEPAPRFSPGGAGNGVPPGRVRARVVPRDRRED